MPKKSQRKGRGGELEVAKILVAAGWDAVANKIYEPLDVNWEGENCEVKRKANGMKPAYDAFKAGAAAFFFRADHKEWTVTFRLDDYIRKHGPQFAITPKGLAALTFSKPYMPPAKCGGEKLE